MTNHERQKVPRHIAVVMDGNGRWARRRGLPRISGHEAGAESVREILRCCNKYGVEYLTLYAFSIENWNRPRKETDALMNLLVRFMDRHGKSLDRYQIRLRIIGRRRDLPAEVRTRLEKAEQDTAAHDSGTLVLALSYGGRAEIADAARALADDVRAGRLDPRHIDENSIAGRLYAPDIPDPDLMIRTSGEQRVSNFLLWQLSYTELYFSRVLWPDFREAHFRRALAAYSRRSRRYGGAD